VDLYKNSRERHSWSRSKSKKEQESRERSRGITGQLRKKCVKETKEMEQIVETRVVSAFSFSHPSKCTGSSTESVWGVRELMRLASEYVRRGAMRMRVGVVCSVGRGRPDTVCVLLLQAKLIRGVELVQE
jgi:hypothetical protein